MTKISTRRSVARTVSGRGKTTFNPCHKPWVVRYVGWEGGKNRGWNAGKDASVKMFSAGGEGQPNNPFFNKRSSKTTAKTFTPLE
jgi:hypothetical protein